MKSEAKARDGKEMGSMVEVRKEKLEIDEDK